jgi:hypothetical protein
MLFRYPKIVLALFETTPCGVQKLLEFRIYSNASTNMKCVTLQFVNNVD